jgi:NMD protein affecting ribosome stability and mRNA decay
VNGKYAGTPKDCASCHTTDFNKTTNPNHVAAAFPTDCSICHTTATWSGAVFNHSKTLFPLTGAHINATCASCHSSGKYAGLSTLCNSCHLTNFNNAKNPNHITAGFPQTCEVCHSTSVWVPSTFDHAKTSFPLTGAHVNVGCANCHIGGKYAGTPTACYSCHKTDYTNVSNPNHVAAAFPTTCATCHTTTTWAGATFTHGKFPIYSGSHAGKWTTCADCHTNSSDYAVFSCTTCHAHDKTTTDQHHQGVRNYVYNSPNCYSCHPVGRAG